MPHTFSTACAPIRHAMTYVSMVMLVLLPSCGEKPASTAPPIKFTTTPVDPLPVVTIDDQDDGRAIIAKAMSVLGDHSAFPNWKRGYARYVMGGAVMEDGAQRNSAIVEEHFDFPDHLRRDVHISNPHEKMDMSYVVSTFGNWQIVPPEKIRRPMPVPAPNPSRHLFADYADMSVLLLGDPVLTRMPDEKRGDGTVCACVEVKIEGEPPMRFWFDRKTSLPVESRKLVNNPVFGGEAELIVVFGEYRQIGSIRVPMRLKVYQQIKLVMDVTFEEIRFESKVDHAIFK